MSTISLDDLPFVTDIEGGAREIHVRHELEPFQKALLDRLGWTYRIDADAPRCERPCGHSRCARTAAELRQIAQLVDEETRRRGLPIIRERVDRQIERGMRVVREPRDVSLVRRPPVPSRIVERADADAAEASSEEEPVTAYTNERTMMRRGVEERVADDSLGRPVFLDVECKIDGCENRANARYDRGLMGTTCWEVHAEQARLQYRRNGAAAARAKPQEERRDLALPPAEPAPAEPAEPEALVGVPDPPAPPDFVELAVEIDEATEELLAAEERYRLARAAVVAHPIFRHLYEAVEYGVTEPAWKSDPPGPLHGTELPAAR